MRSKNIKLFFGLFIFLVISLSLISVFLFSIFRASETVEYGATFSYKYAESFDLDWQDVFEQSVTDLGLKKFRVPIYWSDIEIEKGVYNFDKLDWIMNYAEENNLDITLAIGIKVPRWPECFIPDWYIDYSEPELNKVVFDFIQVAVKRYQNYEALDRWQIENEPYFNFGICPDPSVERLSKEIAIIRSADTIHQIQQTTSGEQSLWYLSSKNVDIIGVSLYRKVWSNTTGDFIFPYGPMFYNIQRAYSLLFVKNVVVSELQAEPWLSAITFENTDNNIDEYYQLFDVNDLRSNVRFANRTGVSEVYFWGIEWWYYLKLNGASDLWDAGREIINN